MSLYFPLLLYSFRIIILMLPICIATDSSAHYSKASPLIIPSTIKTCIMAVNKCSGIPVKKCRDRLKINIRNYIFRHNLDLNFIWHAIIVCLENYFSLWNQNPCVLIFRYCHILLELSFWCCLFVLPQIHQFIILKHLH